MQQGRRRMTATWHSSPPVPASDRRCCITSTAASSRCRRKPATRITRPGPNARSRCCARLTQRYGRAEVEHVISGLGFFNIHPVAHRGNPCAAHVNLDDPDAPAAISRPRPGGRCPGCIETLDCLSKPMARRPGTGRADGVDRRTFHRWRNRAEDPAGSHRRAVLRAFLARSPCARCSRDAGEASSSTRTPACSAPPSTAWGYSVFEDLSVPGSGCWVLSSEVLGFWVLAEELRTQDPERRTAELTCMQTSVS